MTQSRRWMDAVGAVFSWTAPPRSRLAGREASAGSHPEAAGALSQPSDSLFLEDRVWVAGDALGKLDAPGFGGRSLVGVCDPVVGVPCRRAGDLRPQWCCWCRAGVRPRRGSSCAKRSIATLAEPLGP